MITHQELHARMHYDGVAGEATWVTGKWKGHRVGTPNQSGYMQVRINNHSYQLHRVIWLWMTGEWPSAQVDHKNNMRSDNRWSNLRLATAAENTRNVGLTASNTSGFKGVTRPKGRTRWHGYITEDGRRKFLGSFPTAEEAYQATIAARQAAHGEFARH